MSSVMWSCLCALSDTTSQQYNLHSHETMWYIRTQFKCFTQGCRATDVSRQFSCVLCMVHSTEEHLPTLTFSAKPHLHPRLCLISLITCHHFTKTVYFRLRISRQHKASFPRCLFAIKLYYGKTRNYDRCSSYTTKKQLYSSYANEPQL